MSGTDDVRRFFFDMNLEEFFGMAGGKSEAVP